MDDNQEMFTFSITPVQNAIARADFDSLVTSINKQIADLQIDTIDATEENKKMLKQIRQNLNSQFSQIDAERKKVEAILFADYNVFYDEYKLKLKSVFEETSQKLKLKIDDIETKQKERNVEYARAFFNELKEERLLVVLDKFEDISLTIGVNTSEKDIRKQIIAHFDLVEGAQNVAVTLPQDKSDAFIKLFIDTRDINQSLFMVTNVKDDVKIEDVIKSTNIVPRKEYAFVLRLSENEIRSLRSFIEKNLSPNAVISEKEI